MKDYQPYLQNRKTLKDLGKLFNSSKIGIEKEMLRMSGSDLSQSPHPRIIGSALCNSFITTDFAEAQLELVTPPFESKESLMCFLDNLQHFIYKNIKNEYLWPLSIPPFIKSSSDIKIAEYGNSNLGLSKRLYREGLANRYGKHMQTISGIHFNYSLPESIWEEEIFSKQKDLKECKNNIYFSILRNLSRFNWMILYLTGCSPILTRNFLREDRNFTKIDNESSFMRNATSLRMSDFGYQNSNRKKFTASLDSLEDYIVDIRKALSTISPEFQEIQSAKHSAQLNSNILQIEDEYYSIVRPKSNGTESMIPSKNLLAGGVDYIELRSIDLNPFERGGIDNNVLTFIELLIIFCFFRSSDLLTKHELKEIKLNDINVSMNGREPGILLKKEGKNIPLSTWGKEIIDQISCLVDDIGIRSKEIESCLGQIRLMIDDPNNTPSSKLLNDINKEKLSYFDYGRMIAEKYRDHYHKMDISQNRFWSDLDSSAKESLKSQASMEELNEETFNQFLASNFFNDGDR
ncbi:MAG: glutamate--cysteine ligase [Flavobacteriales bacterium]|nr:glutamate--cysteine ligase [Flavobacteriales bacterium]